MASTRKPPTPSTVEQRLTVVGCEIPESAPEFLKDLLRRMVYAFNNNLRITLKRGMVNGYGDALSPTGGIPNAYAIIERKQDRLRAQIWDTSFEGSPIPTAVFDTIDDEINYLLYLKFMLEDAKNLDSL